MQTEVVRTLRAFACIPAHPGPCATPNAHTRTCSALRNGLDGVSLQDVAVGAIRRPPPRDEEDLERSRKGADDGHGADASLGHTCLCAYACVHLRV